MIGVVPLTLLSSRSGTARQLRKVVRIGLSALGFLASSVSADPYMGSVSFLSLFSLAALTLPDSCAKSFMLTCMASPPDHHTTSLNRDRSLRGSLGHFGRQSL